MGLLDFLKRSPRNRLCAHCGQRAAHGYSEAAEADSKRIAPLCLACLVVQLRKDYGEFHGRAIVVAPAVGTPCYVFRELSSLQGESSEASGDFALLLRQIEGCTDCKKSASCLWIGSRGLTLETFSSVLEMGPRKTLLSWGNPAPVSLCGLCTAGRIARSMSEDAYEFFEVCTPHQDQQGIVLPMAY
jgi:hypothetical protein